MSADGLLRSGSTHAGGFSDWRRCLAVWFCLTLAFE